MPTFPNNAEHHTFPDTSTGIKLAWDTTLSFRRHGFTTRLATRQWRTFTVHTVIATPPKRPNRKERGASL